MLFGSQFESIGLANPEGIQISRSQLVLMCRNQNLKSGSGIRDLGKLQTWVGHPLLTDIFYLLI